MRPRPQFDPTEITPAERLRLAHDREAADGDAAVSPELCAELDRRWADHVNDPGAGEPWDAVLAEMLRELDEDEADRASALFISLR